VLLYQMSQWMDERQRLQRELQAGMPETAGALRSQIQELEERLHGQARQWLASFQMPADATAYYEPPQLIDPGPGLL
jgi:hypothetical protein